MTGKIKRATLFLCVAAPWACSSTLEDVGPPPGSATGSGSTVPSGVTDSPSETPSIDSTTTPPELSSPGGATSPPPAPTGGGEGDEPVSLPTVDSSGFSIDGELALPEAPPEPTAEPATADCSAFSASAAAKPVDIALLIDRSGSMADRWGPLMEALDGFLLRLNPASHLALQVFPEAGSLPQAQPSGLDLLRNQGICGDCSTGDCLPQTCTSDVDCGGSTCNQEFGICTCQSDGECNEAGSICHRSWCDRGNISIDLGQPPIQMPLCGGITQCDGGAPCRSFGELARAVATPTPTDDSEAYETPLVPFTLDHTEVQIALDGIGPNGRTPMAQALEGYQTYLRADLEENPDRRAVVLLVSDGLPDGAEAGLAAAVSLVGELRQGLVDTYLIGITTADDAGARVLSEGLQQLAAAGSEREAFLVEDGGDTLGELETTLNQIIEAANVECEFELPAPPDGRSLDLENMTLVVTEGSVAGEAPFVLDPSECNPAAPGWHFDALPPVVEVPSSVLLCPGLCDRLTRSATVSVDFSVSCEAVREPPRAPIR